MCNAMTNTKFNRIGIQWYVRGSLYGDQMTNVSSFALLVAPVNRDYGLKTVIILNWVVK